MLFAKNREVVELLGVVPPQNIIAINDSSMGSFISDTLRGMCRMRRLKFDAVIDCELFSRISSILAFLSGAAVRVGADDRRERHGGLIGIVSRIEDDDFIAGVNDCVNRAEQSFGGAVGDGNFTRGVNLARIQSFDLFRD